MWYKLIFESAGSEYFGLCQALNCLRSALRKSSSLDERYQRTDTGISSAPERNPGANGQALWVINGHYGFNGVEFANARTTLARSRHEFTRFKGMTAAPPAFWALEEKCMMCFLSIQLVQFFHQWWQFGAPENPENSMANGSYTGEVAEGSNGPSQVSSSASLRSTRSVACHNRTRTNRKKGISFVVSSLKFHTTESQRKSWDPCPRQLVIGIF